MANRSNFYKLDMLILSVLKEQDCYGYQINKSIKDSSEQQILIGDGTMYNILYKLLDAGYITSYDKVVGRKVRVYYHIEPDGLEHLKQLVQEFEAMVKTVQAIIYR